MELAIDIAIYKTKSCFNGVKQDFCGVNAHPYYFIRVTLPWWCSCLPSLNVTSIM